jgi:hypothetical protein
MGKEGRQIGSQGTFSNATLLARHQNFDCAHVAVLFEKGEGDDRAILGNRQVFLLH